MKYAYIIVAIALIGFIYFTDVFDEIIDSFDGVFVSAKSKFVKS